MKKKTDCSKVNTFYERYKTLNRERLNMFNRLQFKRITLYFDDDGNEVTDLNCASKDDFGNPIVSRLSPKDVIPVDSKNPRITFNPNDSLSRQRAFTARVALSEMVSMPTDYRDNFKSIEYVNNVAEKVVNIVHSQNTNKD